MHRLLHILLLGVALGAPGLLARTRAAAWVEDFATDPATRGWATRGDPGLFRWDPEGQRLAATWDSTRTNTFFHRPLGTILSRAESFRLRFVLQLDEVTPSSPDGTFQLAVGFLRQADGFRTNLFRGSGIHPVTGARDLVEFNYFPASRTIAPTLAAVAVGTNYVRWSMANLFPFELTPGPRYGITLAFDTTTQLLRLEVVRDGIAWASGTTRIEDRAGDFRLDAVAVTSYSGAGQPAGYGGNILAHGWIDDIEVEHPDAPALRLIGHRTDTDPVIRLAMAVPPAGWKPHLEGSSDSTTWIPVDQAPLLFIDGTHWSWALPPGTLPPTLDPTRFFRVRLDRP